MTPQPYTLTEAEYDACVDAAVASRKGTATTRIDVANAVYRLGFQRGRVVKPLAFTKQSYLWQEAEPSIGHRYTIFNRDFVTWVCRINGDIFAYGQTATEADSACQAHHEQFVLSMLEAV